MATDSTEPCFGENVCANGNMFPGPSAKNC